MDKSPFTDKSRKPGEKELAAAIGETLVWWNQVRDHVHAVCPGVVDEWNFPGEKYGWSFRIKDKKRAIVYLLPRDGYFKVAMIFCPKAYEAILASDVEESIKQELREAKVYAEGRGIRIEFSSEKQMADIKLMIFIKCA